MSTKEPDGKLELSLVPKGGERPATFLSREITSFTEKRVRKGDRRQRNDRRSMIRFEPGKDADRRSLQDRRRAGSVWSGYDI
jgi:hypothetical protein